MRPEHAREMRGGLEAAGHRDLGDRLFGLQQQVLRPVQPHRARKSIGTEDTFLTDIRDPAAARHEVATLAEKVWRHCDDKKITGRTVTLKVKFADFQQITRSRTMVVPVTDGDDLTTVALALLELGKRILAHGVSSRVSAKFRQGPPAPI